MVEARYGEQRGDGRLARTDSAVRQDDDGDPFRDGLVHSGAQLCHGCLKPRTAGSGVEVNREGRRPKPRRVQLADSSQLIVGEDRGRQAEHPATDGLGGQQVPLRADRCLQSGDDLLPHRVDGRVGDLGEELLEVGEQQLRALRQHGQRHVVAHGAEGLHSIPGHGRHEDPQVLVGVPEGVLTLEQRCPDFCRGCAGRDRWEVSQLHQVLIEPLPIGPGGGHGRLQLVVADNGALLRVDEEHPSRLKPSLVQDPVGREVQHADLGREHHEPIAGHVVARGPKTVSVQHGAHADSIGEADRGRPVPGLHEAREVLVERTALVTHAVVLRPRLGDHHHDRLREAVAAEHEELEAVVEHGRVAALRIDDREHLLEVIAEQIGLEHRLPGSHPVHIPAQCVDLAIVDDQTVGMRPIPAWECVRRESRVDDADRRLDPRIGKVRVVLLHLVGSEHAFVDNGPR